MLPIMQPSQFILTAAHVAANVNPSWASGRDESGLQMSGNLTYFLLLSTTLFSFSDLLSRKKKKRWLKWHRFKASRHIEGRSLRSRKRLYTSKGWAMWWYLPWNSRNVLTGGRFSDSFHSGRSALFFFFCATYLRQGMEQINPPAISPSHKSFFIAVEREAEGDGCWRSLT